MSNNGDTLYIFIDESGNFDFTPNGTKSFVLTAVSTKFPLKSRSDLLNKVCEIKYENWKEGKGDYCFHATEDLQVVRDWVFAEIAKLDDIEIDSIIAQKNKTNPSLYIKHTVNDKLKGGVYIKTIRTEEKLYDKLSQLLLQYIIARHNDKEDIKKIIIVLGSLFTEKKRGQILKSLKTYLKYKCKKTSYVYFYKTSNDINCQIADYCCWAVYVGVERKEMRPYEDIKSKVKSTFDVFKAGEKEYYEYKK